MSKELNEETAEILDAYYSFWQQAQLKGIILSREKCMQLTQIWALKNRKEFDNKND